MNGYEYRQSNVAFDERLKHEIAKIKYDFSSGKIKTQTDYAYAMKQLLIDFYNNVGKPTFQFHRAATVPSYDNYTDMISKAIDDISTILIGTEQNTIDLNCAKNKTDDSINILTNRLDTLENTTTNLKEKINSLRLASDVVFSDDFTKNRNSNSLYSQSIGMQEAYANLNTGVLTLGTTRNRSVPENNIDVEILDTSNGFPGNTHEIYNSIGTVNNNIKFKGENNPHSNINLIKTANTETGSSSDWFEFEMFNISDSLKESTNMIGFNYKEGISWVSNDDELRLDLKLTLQAESDCNYIIVKAAPKTNANVANPIIQQVIISDSSTIMQKIDVNRELTGDVFITFNSQKAKEVIIRLKQQDYAAVKVCREYALNIDPTKIPKFTDDDAKDFIQVDCPTQSIESIGLKYDDENKSIIYPNTKTSVTFIDNEYSKSNLFYSNLINGNYQMKKEAVDANRYFIGLKGVDVRYRKYTSTGFYVSQTFESDEPIKQITLNSSDYIPDDFYNYLEEGTSINDYIKYFISFDDGNEWHRIHPRHKAQDGPCTININSSSAILNRNKNIEYIDLMTDPTSFKVKIELTRPKEIEDETPMIYEYHLDVSTREEF